MYMIIMISSNHESNIRCIITTILPYLAYGITKRSGSKKRHNCYFSISLNDWSSFPSCESMTRRFPLLLVIKTDASGKKNENYENFQKSLGNRSAWKLRLKKNIIYFPPPCFLIIVQKIVWGIEDHKIPWLKPMARHSGDKGDSVEMRRFLEVENPILIKQS